MDELPSQYTSAISNISFGGSKSTRIPVLILPSSLKRFWSKKHKLPLNRVETIEIALHNPPQEQYSPEEMSKFVLLLFEVANPRVYRSKPKDFKVQITKVEGGNASQFLSTVKEDITTVYPGLSAFIQIYKSGLSVKHLHGGLEICIATLFKPDASKDGKLVVIKDGATLNPV